MVPLPEEDAEGKYIAGEEFEAEGEMEVEDETHAEGEWQGAQGVQA